MKKEIRSGICRLCGKEGGKLTFEHVPLHASFNNAPIKELNLLDCITEDEKMGLLPWEEKNSWGRISQKGIGGYYLCERCNSCTGSWYGNDYAEFVKTLMFVLAEAKDYEINTPLSFKVMKMYPLRIYKQVMTMFCDINPHLTEEDPSLREFLLNKENCSFDASKYRLYMYLLRSGYSRVCNFSYLFLKGVPKPVSVSEIANIPAGFLLYKDIPAEVKVNECEISSFAKAAYNDVSTILLTVNIHENNNYIVADFRTKDEIEQCVIQSQEDQEPH